MPSWHAPQENLNPNCPNCARGTYTYNKANLLTSLVYSGTTSSTQPSYSYGYALDGNQTMKMESSGRVTSYAYDDLGRLTRKIIVNAK